MYVVVLPPSWLLAVCPSLANCSHATATALQLCGAWCSHATATALHLCGAIYPAIQLPSTWLCVMVMLLPSGHVVHDGVVMLPSNWLCVVAMLQPSGHVVHDGVVMLPSNWLCVMAMLLLHA